MLKKISKIMVIFMILAFVFTALSFAESQEAKRPFRLTWGWPVHIDPGVGCDTNSIMCFVNLYDGLVYPSEDGEPQSHIAKSWETSEDGLVWTFHLREGVKFHDGTELNAEDVKFSMDRMVTRGQGFGYLFTDRVVNTEVVDDYTVSIHLKVPFSPFLGALYQFFIVNKDLVMENIEEGKYGEFGDYGEKFLNLNEAGSGPYKIKEFDYGSHITLEQNPEYWIPVDPNCPDEWKYYATLPTSTIKVMLQKRELELCGHDISLEALKTCDAMEGIEIGVMGQGDVFYGMLNNKKAPTDDIHVRKALAWAMDYKTITEVIFPGFVQARGPISHDLAGFDPTVFQYQKDLEKAKEEIKKSKYYGELDKYPISIHWTSELEDMEKVCLLLMSDLKKIGVTIDMVRTPWVSIVEQCGSLETSPNMTIVSTAPGYPEAGSTFECRYKSSTARSWEQNEWLLDPDLDKRISDAVQIQDREERFKAYSELQHYLVDLCPSLFIMDRVTRHPYQEYYMDWPLSGGSNGYKVNGYNTAGRFIRIYPEKRDELVK